MTKIILLLVLLFSERILLEVIETNDGTKEFIHWPGGEGRASMDYSVEADDDNDVEYNSEEDLDKLLDEELDDLGIFVRVVFVVV